MIVGIVWSVVARAVLIPHFGHSAVIVFMACPSLLALLLLTAAPEDFAPLPTATAAGSGHRSAKRPIPSLLVLSSVGFWAAFMTVIWVFSEPLATHYTGYVLTWWLTVSLICQVLGAALSAIVAERFPYRTVVSLGLIVSVVQVVAYSLGVSGAAFVLWNAVSGFIGYFLYPFFIRALIETDPTRRSVVLFPAAFNLAGSLGPMVVSGFVSDSDLRRGLLIDLGFVAVALLLFWCALWVFRRQQNRDIASALILSSPPSIPV
jgi:hypothetical protein